MKARYLILLLLLLIPFGVFADHNDTEVDVNFFYSKTCHVCGDMKPFLEELEGENCELNVNRYIASQESDLLEGLYREYDVPKIEQGRVPITFIGSMYFVGFDEQTEADIRVHIRHEIDGTECPLVERERKEVKFLGFTIKTDKMAPLPLSIILGTLDGFNACAMVALGFSLTTLIATGTRKRLILIGGTFILVSGAVYFLFISTWLNLFLISKNLELITMVAGIVVLIFAITLFREYIHGIICKICQIPNKKDSIFTKAQRKLFDKLRELTKKEISTIVLLLGVIVIAIGVNSVELICSFGFPVAFTKILTNMNLTGLSYYFYLLIYIIFYMIDDFLIFLFAVITLRITGVSEKYLKYIKLISAFVLFILGLVLLIKPDLLALF